MKERIGAAVKRWHNNGVLFAFIALICVLAGDFIAAALFWVIAEGNRRFTEYMQWKRTEFVVKVNDVAWDSVQQGINDAMRQAGR